MIVKVPIMKNRIRQIPKSFSWVDHRLVREKYIEACTHEQSALYLFLVCVADARGLSYYSDKAIMKILDMNLPDLEQARSGLIKNNLIAWQEPIYQVLSLEPKVTTHRSGQLIPK
jgi:SET domain-containing protein